MNGEARRQVNFRLSELDMARLQAVAERYALERGAVIRMLIKREFDTIEGKKST